MRNTFRFVLFLLAIGIAATTGWLAHAQTAAPNAQIQTPTIISGNDLGFRIDPRQGAPFGTLVIRVNGQWVDAKFSGGARLLTNK